MFSFCCSSLRYDFTSYQLHGQALSLADDRSTKLECPSGFPSRCHLTRMQSQKHPADNAIPRHQVSASTRMQCREGRIGGSRGAGCQHTREERVVDRRGAVVRGWSRREERRVWGIKSQSRSAPAASLLPDKTQRLLCYGPPVCLDPELRSPFVSLSLLFSRS